MKHPIDFMAKSWPSRIIFWDPGVDPTARFICQASAGWWRSGKNPLGADNSVWKIGDPIFTNKNRKPDPIHWIIMIISFPIKMALAGVYSPFSDTPNSLGISWQCSHARRSIHKKDMWELFSLCHETYGYILRQWRLGKAIQVRLHMVFSRKNWLWLCSIKMYQDHIGTYFVHPNWCQCVRQGGQRPYIAVINNEVGLTASSAQKISCSFPMTLNCQMFRL